MLKLINYYNVTQRIECIEICVCIAYNENVIIHEMR